MLPHFQKSIAFFGRFRLLDLLLLWWEEDVGKDEYEAFMEWC